MDNKLEQFSPIVTSGSSVPKSKRLTGIPLQVRDLVIDVHTNIQRWNTIYQKGIPILQRIVDLKIDESYPEDLIELCSLLEKVCEEIEEIVNNLQIITHKMENLKLLHGRDGILFLTWSMDKYVNTMKTIYISYKGEAKIKRMVVENIAHETGDVAKIVYFTSWAYQPEIPANLTFKIEAMLIETGLRKIL